MDPQMDPVRLILGDPCPKKASQSPFKVQVGQLFQLDLHTTEELKVTAWFEVDPTFRGKNIAF